MVLKKEIINTLTYYVFLEQVFHMEEECPSEMQLDGKVPHCCTAVSQQQVCSYEGIFVDSLHGASERLFNGVCIESESMRYAGISVGIRL